MVLNTKVIGIIIWQMVRGNFGMLTVMFMKANGETIKSMDSVFITI